jgi:hypothetical protein
MMKRRKKVKRRKKKTKRRQKIEIHLSVIDMSKPKS